MKTYRVKGYETVMYYVDIRAENKADAYTKAMDVHVDDWIEETSQPYETIFSERHDGIYIVDKDWEKKI